MTACPSCQHANRPERRFCAECGAGLGVACAACRTPNEPGEKFCGGCGASLLVEPAQRGGGSPPAPAPLVAAPGLSGPSLEGERKQVTVLFADVQGSMEMAEQMDPEAWSQVMQRFFAILADGVERFGGFVDKFTGDGIMALFGAPLAHEDHAQRACFAALHLRDRLRQRAEELSAELGVQFSFRFGLNSGEVIVGTIRRDGSDLRMDYTAQGHTVGLAQRMEQLAPADGIALSQNTQKSVEGFFNLHSLGPTEVKGSRLPIGVFVLEGVSDLRTRFEVARARGLTRFVGRGAEMDILDSALARARAGNGQVIGVVAEAGTGKSRLCFEFTQRCRSTGARVIVGRCEPYGRNIPLLPILQVFRDYYGISEQDSDQTTRQKLAGRLLSLDDEFRDVLPVLYEFFGVPDPDHPAPPLDAELKQRQLFGVLRKVVQNTAEHTVALIEDLHWLDGASAQWLDQWVEAVAGTRFVLLVNFRPEFQGSWVHKSYYHQLPLAPLTPQAVHHLLEGLLGSDPSTDGLAEAIHQRTGGNPFFTEEVVQSMIESGLLEGSDGNYRLTAAVESLEVPASVHAVLAARIDRLSEEDKKVLQTAAVVGKDFSEPVLERVMAAVAPPGPAQGRMNDPLWTNVGGALRSLTRAEFIHEQALYPVAEYTFKHPLTQQVAYETLLKERRTRVHEAVARAMGEIYSERIDEKAALLAHHCEHAGQPWEAALWHRRAADWAGITNAAEGLRHWRRVRALVKPLALTPDTVELGVAACVGQLNLAWRLGSPIDEASEAFEEGCRLAEQAGDVRAQAALHGTYGCALGLVGGDPDQYVHHSREGTRLADQTGDQALQIAQRAYLGYATVFAGRFREGLASCEGAVRTLPADPSLGVEYTGYSALAGVLMSQAWILARLGRVDEASRVCDRADRVARDYGDLEVLTWLQLTRVEIDVFHGDAEAAHAHARSALETGAKTSTPQSMFVGPFVLAVAHRLSGQWDDALVVCEEALALAATGTNRMFMGWVGAELVGIRLARGEVEEAEVAALAAVDVSRKQHFRYDGVKANVALARVLLERGDSGARTRAEEALDRAQELVDETQGRALQPEIHECRGRLARLRGDEAVAIDQLNKAQLLHAELGGAAS